MATCVQLFSRFLCDSSSADSLKATIHYSQRALHLSQEVSISSLRNALSYFQLLRVSSTIVSSSTVSPLDSHVPCVPWPQSSQATSLGIDVCNLIQSQEVEKQIRASSAQQSKGL